MIKNTFISIDEYQNMLKELARRLPQDKINMGRYFLYYSENMDADTSVCADVKLVPTYIDDYNIEFKIFCTINIHINYLFTPSSQYNQLKLSEFDNQINNCRMFAEYDFDACVVESRKLV